jgi:hypothetical protein
MTWTVDPQALAPLRLAMISEARVQADAVVSEAYTQADEVVETAVRAAAEPVASARSQGTDDAVSVAAREESAARLEARTTVLSARRKVEERFREQVLTRVRDLQNDTVYADLRTALLRHSRARLGRSTTAREVDGGGVIVETADCLIDASLDALARWAAELDDGYPGAAT